MTGLDLKKLRIKHELTKHRLCEKLGIHISTLNNWVGRMDRKVERWGDLPNDDPDLVAFRKVVGA